MTQKQLITANNAELEKHKQDILSLPMADDVKNGKYVWKKYEYTPAETIQVINPKSTLTYYKSDSFKVSSDDYNVNSVDISFFNGFTLAVAKYDQYIINDGYVTINGGNIEVVYDKTNAILTVKGITYSSSDSGTLNYNGIKTYKKEEKIGGLIGYIVSDLETAYPDGGEKDGYWYERVKGSKYGMFVDETNETEDPTKVRMIFPKIGDSYFRVSNSTNMFMMCYSIKDLEVETESIGVYAFSNTFRFTELNKLKLKCKSIGNNAFKSMGMDKKSYTKIFLSNRIATISAQAYNYSPFSTSSPNMKLYCESPSKPTGWSEYWNNITSSTKLTTMWGVTESQFDAL